MAKWLEIAHRIQSALDNRMEAGKLATIEKTAGELGISEQSARNILRARTFVEDFSTYNPKLAHQISTLPYPAVLVLRKWFDRDFSGASDFLYNNNSFSVREVAAAEQASRSNDPLARPPAPAQHFLEILATSKHKITAGHALAESLAWSGLSVPDLRALPWQATKGDYEQTIGVEFCASLGTGTAGITVGSTSQVLSTYERQAKMIWARAVCAASLHPLVIVLLPNQPSQRLCLKAMPMPPSGSEGWPQWNSASEKPERPPFRPATPSGGVVFFTTPETVEVDWQS